MIGFTGRFLLGTLVLVSSASQAATVSVTPTDANPLPGAVFAVIVHGDGFPTTAGATLGLSWNSATVEVIGVTLAPGSPFTGGVVAAAPWNPISILGPLVGTLPSGSFDAFQINFRMIAEGPLNIVLIDDQSDLCWSDAVTFGCVTPVQYTQVNVCVLDTPGCGQPPIPDVPIPASGWLAGSAAAAAIARSRRRLGRAT